jgi:hypothetical protein
MVASIKPQQPQNSTIVYPAVRKLEPGYSKVYTPPLERVWKIPAILWLFEQFQTHRTNSYL